MYVIYGWLTPVHTVLERVPIMFVNCYLMLKCDSVSFKQGMGGGTPIFRHGRQGYNW